MSLYEKLRDALEAEEAVAMATLVGGPRELGAKALVRADGSMEGEIVSAELSGRVVPDAVRLLREERTEAVSYETSEGKFDVFIEAFPAPARILIVGAGDIAETLGRMAKLMGYAVTVVDARAAFIRPDRFPDADRVIKGWPQDVLPQVPLDENTYVVLLSHDNRFDQPTLEYVLPSKVRYVGAIGSRKTQTERYGRLRDQGFSEQQLAKIRGPVGLDLGARTPQEIALAIMAEITAVRRGKDVKTPLPSEP